MTYIECGCFCDCDTAVWKPEEICEYCEEGNHFILPTIPTEEFYDPVTLPELVICDIDGTLADNELRHYRDYDLVEEDSLIVPVWEALKDLSAGRQVFMITGRPDSHREETTKWLHKNNVPFNKLFMRKTGDHQPDYKAKKEIYFREIFGKYKVRLVLEDRDQVVKMWRELGLTCFQVAEGDF